MISNKIAFCNVDYENSKYLASILYIDNKPELLLLDSKDEPSNIGDIFTGRVVNIKKELNAAFVKIDENREVFLPLDKNRTVIYTKKSGKSKNITCSDEILVEITGDAQKQKIAMASSEISMSNDYAVILASKNTDVCASKKIPDNKACELKSLVSKHILEDGCDYSEKIRKITEFNIILRTNCLLSDESTIISAIDSLLAQFCEFIFSAIHQKPYFHYSNKNKKYIEFVNKCKDRGIEEIVCDDRKVYEYLNAEFSKDIYADFKNILRFYDDEYEMQKLLGLGSVIEKALCKKVWLKSGAFLYIEQLETLTFIDVNSGKKTSGKDKSENVFNVNKEAVYEIARQLKIRNISGIIIVDFINMPKSREDDILSLMKSTVKDDFCYVKPIDFTSLGLMEITREKKYQSLREKVLTKRNMS